jgi:hypothetical protein
MEPCNHEYRFVNGYNTCIKCGLCDESEPQLYSNFLLRDEVYNELVKLGNKNNENGSRIQEILKKYSREFESHRKQMEKVIVTKTKILESQFDVVVDKALVIYLFFKYRDKVMIRNHNLLLLTIFYISSILSGKYISINEFCEYFNKKPRKLRMCIGSILQYEQLLRNKYRQEYLKLLLLNIINNYGLPINDYKVLEKKVLRLNKKYGLHMSLGAVIYYYLPRYGIKLTQETIASMFGISVVTLRTALREVKNHG